jgi:hypothetical protein
VVFNKVEIRLKTANATEIYIKKKTGKRTTRQQFLGGLNLITGGRQIPSGYGEDYEVYEG